MPTQTFEVSIALQSPFRLISSLINEIDETRDDQITSPAIENWMETNRTRKEFYSSDENKESDLWKNQIHGADFLDALFEDLIKTSGIKYDKKIHSVKLTEWILKNSVDDLIELRELLRSIINEPPSHITSTNKN